jgi:hypothetical protein
MLSADSGIVWGTVRDAATYQELGSAIAQIGWYDLNPDTASAATGFSIRDVQREVGTDEGGVYVACGVPTDIRLSSTAIAPRSASGQVEYQVGPLRLQRMDFLVSTDMVIPDSLHLETLEDSMTVQRARGGATVRGTVLDYRKKPMANTTVRIAGIDTSVRTRKNGQFIVSGLPAGTHVVEARRVGYAPYSEIVHLRPDSITVLRVAMPDISTLTTINVRASTTSGRDRLGYEERRKQGLGYFLDPKAMGRKTDLGSILTLVPTVEAHRQPNGMYVTVPTPSSFHCLLAPFLDGVATSWDIIYMRTPDKYRAIEVYPQERLVPNEYSWQNDTKGRPCGVVLFWSYGAKW